MKLEWEWNKIMEKKMDMDTESAFNLLQTSAGSSTDINGFDQLHLNQSKKGEENIYLLHRSKTG